MSDHDFLKLSARQLEYLRACESRANMSSWSVGSATVSSLRTAGLIEKVRIDGVTMNRITDAGRAALKAGS